MDKRFWGFLIVIAVILGGVFFVSNTNKAGAPTGSGTLTNHVEGSTTSGVKLVEYGDFQCPACGQYYQSVKDTVAKYGDRVQFQFRNFPLYQIHPNAIAGARAAEAADLQSKYWEMHDMLYENQASWVQTSDPTPQFVSYAKSLGLDATKFQTDYKSASVNDRIQADLKEGQKLGVDSTPTFFLDGKKISNPNPTVADFSKIIDAELAQKSTAQKSTTTTPATTAQ